MARVSTVRVREIVTPRPVAPAKIIPFPVRPQIVAAPVQTPPRPSLGVSIALALILTLACLLWEAMSMSPGTLVDAGQTAITAPRALLDVCRCDTPALS